ncbi:MAG: ABC transporter permease, partial [Oligoflexia bacterium]|nr:ABC transporter permease [Oligoflexia bacterium]
IHYSFDPRNTDAQLTYWITRSILENDLSIIADGQVTSLDIPGTRYLDYLLPGLIAMGVMMSCMWGISYGLIERRAKKLLRRLVATPMNKSYYLLSIIFARIIFGLIESAALIIFAFLFFDFKIYGSWSLVLLLFLIGHFAFSGIAILVAARTTTIETGTGIINAITTPMIVLSGIFFSYQHFPNLVKSIVSILPLTMVVDSFRKVMLEGGGMQSIQTELGGLVLIGVFCFAVGLKIFKWY